LRHSENLAQNRISKVEGIPDPESYLEDVVLALSSSAYASHTDDLNQGERLTIDGGDQEVIHKVQPQPAKLDSPPESSMEKGKGENTDPNGMRGYVSGIQPGKLLEYSTDSGKPQEILAQHSRGSDRAGEAVEYHVETGSNQMFAKNDGGNVISNRSIIDNPNTAFLQDCRKKVCHLLEGNLLLEKQRRMAGALHKVEGNIANEQEVQLFLS
jgi:Pyruvate/2-oxoacid:ferredoxin oxidoreductase gamma subunit